jgi:hypothetical protein
MTMLNKYDVESKAKPKRYKEKSAAVTVSAMASILVPY